MKFIETVKQELYSKSKLHSIWTVGVRTSTLPPGNGVVRQITNGEDNESFALQEIQLRSIPCHLEDSEEFELKRGQGKAKKSFSGNILNALASKNKKEYAGFVEKYLLERPLLPEDVRHSIDGDECILVCSSELAESLADKEVKSSIQIPERLSYILPFSPRILHLEDLTIYLVLDSMQPRFNEDMVELDFYKKEPTQDGDGVMLLVNKDFVEAPLDSAFIFSPDVMTVEVPQEEALIFEKINPHPEQDSLVIHLQGCWMPKQRERGRMFIFPRITPSQSTE